MKKMGWTGLFLLLLQLKCFAICPTAIDRSVLKHYPEAHEDIVCLFLFGIHKVTTKVLEQLKSPSFYTTDRTVVRWRVQYETRDLIPSLLYDQYPVEGKQLIQFLTEKWTPDELTDLHGHLIRLIEISTSSTQLKSLFQEMAWRSDYFSIHKTNQYFHTTLLLFDQFIQEIEGWNQQKRIQTTPINTDTWWLCEGRIGLLNAAFALWKSKMNKPQKTLDLELWVDIIYHLVSTSLEMDLHGLPDCP